MNTLSCIVDRYVVHTKRITLFLGIVVSMLAAQPVLAAATIPDIQASQTYTTAVPPTPPAQLEFEDDQRLLTGDRIIGDRNFTLRSNEVLQGDLTLLGSNVLLEEGSRVEGSVSVFGGNLDAYGTISNDLTQIGGNVHLRQAARVMGRFTTVGGRTMRDPGSYVGNQITTADNYSFRWNFPTGRIPLLDHMIETLQGYIAAIAGVILVTLLSVAILAVFPANVAQMAQTARLHWLPAGGVGMLTYIAVPIICLLLTITICLIPASIVLAVVWAVAIIIGWVVVARILGEKMATGLGAQCWTPIAQMVLGSCVLGILGSIPIIGLFIGFVTSAIGLGALILTRAGTQPFPAPGVVIASS